MPVTNVINKAALEALLKSHDGAVAKDITRRGLRVVSAAKRNLSSNPSRVDTGRLRSSISFRLVSVNGSLTGRVGTNVKYAIFVHEGTGLFGPRHTLIVPRNKKALRWKTRGGGHTSANGYTFSKH